MNSREFNNKLADAQASVVRPISPEQFDFEAYENYENSLLSRCREFWVGDEGVLVYRRMRVADVYAGGCGDMNSSLEWQLGALSESIKYQADVPNFLEPWYGIATIASAFGASYVWNDDLAPAAHPLFDSIEEALRYPVVPVATTPIGKHTLEMIDFFISRTGGRLPVSLTDTQSPLNTACNLVDVNKLFIDMVEKPDLVREFLDRLASLLIEFNAHQLERLGRVVVWPGHGFASTRTFEGLGMSDDQMIMLSADMYKTISIPSMVKSADHLGGVVFHSCGNWSGKVETVRGIPGLRMVDAAMTPQTDPQPNPPEVIAEAFAGSGITVNARMVGDPDTIEDCVRKLWRPGLKLIAVTYCQTPDEQAEAYRRIHSICG